MIRGRWGHVLRHAVDELFFGPLQSLNLAFDYAQRSAHDLVVERNRLGGVARKHRQVVGKLCQPLGGPVELPGLLPTLLRVGVQVRPPDALQEQRVAGEEGARAEPISGAFGRVARRVEDLDGCGPDLERVPTGQRYVFE